MRQLGWFDRPGVEVFEGTWQAYFKAIDDGSVEARVFDAVYCTCRSERRSDKSKVDTFSEHYRDLHAFFEMVPNILRDDSSRFSFFHGLGATSRTLYDVYTCVGDPQASADRAACLLRCSCATSVCPRRGRTWTSRTAARRRGTASFGATGIWRRPTVSRSVGP